jgi:hypothetical protein
VYAGLWWQYMPIFSVYSPPYTEKIGMHCHHSPPYTEKIGMHCHHSPLHSYEE